MVTKVKSHKSSHFDLALKHHDMEFLITVYFGLDVFEDDGWAGVPRRNLPMSDSLIFYNF